MRIPMFESINERLPKLETMLALGVAVVALAAASPAVASAEGVTVNRGACMSYLGQTGQTELAPYQAPGQTGNGPLTIVNGQNIVPPAFEGGVGCSL